ncbi:MAG: type I-C CRISPR-associated protein Cas8c/Csd1 [Syntrophobacterales bacterium]|jgi:CRISPR-associated protein Csd1|nr:type I-C CRISPR-associated protein Cas8c/Csd1 [Syntrophobacterales bacterium]
MFRALVDLGHDLEPKGVLPHPGFYYYKEPVKWIVHLWEERVYLEETQLNHPRPFSGRTSGVEAHLLIDEAGYALGVNKDKNGLDKRADEKHKAFCKLLRKFQAWEGLKDPALKEAMNWLDAALKQGRLRQDPRLGEILTKDWLSFVPGAGPLLGQHLFEHDDARRFWTVELQSRSTPGGKKDKRLIRGQCAVCGKEAALLGKIPVGVKLVGNTPLHSINADAFASFISGPDAFKKAHIGLCFECGDTASRAFNYLSNSEQHRRVLVFDKKKDSLANQIALFWVKDRAPVQVGDKVFDLSSLSSVDFGAALAGIPKGPASATVSQLLELLRLPWSSVDSSLSLNDYGFYLGILSPNVGRIALREWVAVSLEKVKKNLAKFLEASRIVSAWGEEARPLSIGTLLQALETKNPNLTRQLLRTAYLGYDPPEELWVAAVNRFRIPNILQDARETWRLQVLASSIKLGLYYKKEVDCMYELNSDHQNSAYLCGCLLAILEEAQQVATFLKIGKRLERTVVNNSYGGASTAPKAIFGRLMNVASTAHLPEVGRKLNESIEKVMSSMVEAGGFPKILNLEGQADFALGFYHRRAAFRANREKEKDEGENQ